MEFLLGLRRPLDRHTVSLRTGHHGIRPLTHGSAGRVIFNHFLFPGNVKKLGETYPKISDAQNAELRLRWGQIVLKNDHQEDFWKVKGFLQSQVGAQPAWQHPVHRALPTALLPRAGDPQVDPGSAVVFVSVCECGWRRRRPGETHGLGFPQIRWWGLRARANPCLRQGLMRSSRAGPGEGPGDRPTSGGQ